MTLQFRETSLGTLADPIGSGGQGEIFIANISINGHSGPYLYKRYKPRIGPVDSAVLVAMVDYIHSLSRSDSHSLLSLCSWPLAIVTDNSDCRVTGFVMQRAPDRFRYIRLSGGNDISYASIQYLLVDDRRFKMYTSSQPLLYLEKLAIISKLAVALENLHGRGIAVGDLSPRNVLAALSPDYSIFFIDVDSMRFQGRSVAPQVETPNWQITRAFPGEELATIESDCYKLALFSLRLLCKEIGTYQISNLPSETSFKLRSLIQSTLSQCAVTRPKTDTWTALLKPFSDCKQIAAELLLQANSRLASSAWDDAILLFDRAIRLSSDSFGAYIGRANAHCELGKFGDAIADYTRAIQLNPIAPNLYNDRGYAKFYSGDKNGALDDFNREASNYPNSATTIYNRAWVKHKLGDTVGSLSDLRRVMHLDPNLLEGPTRKWAKDLLATNQQTRQQTVATYSTSSRRSLISSSFSLTRLLYIIWKHMHVRKTSFMMIGVFVFSACLYSLNVRVEDQLRLAKERSSLDEVKRSLVTGDYVGCIQKASSIREGLRNEIRIEADSLRARCMNAKNTAEVSSALAEKRKAFIGQCQQEGDWAVVARIEDTEERTRILSVVRQEICSNSYINGDTILASRTSSEKEAIALVGNLNRLIASKRLSGNIGFVAQSRNFLAGSVLLSPFECELTKPFEGRQGITKTKCNAFFKIQGRYATPLVEMVINTADGDGLNIDWYPRENGFENNGGASVSCHETNMVVEIQNKNGQLKSISLPFSFLPCKTVQLSGICANQDHLNECYVYMQLGACIITHRSPWRIANGQTSMDLTINSLLKMRFSRSSPSSMDGGRVSFFQRLDDTFPRTDYYVWSQKEGGVDIDIGGSSLLIGGILIQ